MSVLPRKAGISQQYIAAAVSDLIHALRCWNTSMLLMIIGQDVLLHQTHSPLLPKPPRSHLHSPGTTVVARPALINPGTTNAGTMPPALCQPTDPPPKIAVDVVTTLKLRRGVPAARMTAPVKNLSSRDFSPPIQKHLDAAVAMTSALPSLGRFPTPVAEDTAVLFYKARFAVLPPT